MLSFSLVGDILIVLVAVLHVVIFNLESLSWFTKGAKTFRIKPELVQPTSVLAANQGFYNLVLAVGLIYSLFTGQTSDKLFFVTGVFACGVIGFVTTDSAKILQIQCAPTGLALVFIFVGQSQLDQTAVGAVVGAIVGSIAIATFIKSKLKADGAKHAAKLQK